MLQNICRSSTFASAVIRPQIPSDTWLNVMVQSKRCLIIFSLSSLKYHVTFSYHSHYIEIPAICKFLDCFVWIQCISIFLPLLIEFYGFANASILILGCKKVKLSVLVRFPWSLLCFWFLTVPCCFVSVFCITMLRKAGFALRNYVLCTPYDY